MAQKQPSLSWVLALLVLVVTAAIFSIVFTDLADEQKIAAILLSKVLIGALAALFLLHYQLKWAFMKYDLSLLDFYTHWKFFKYNHAMGAGIVLLLAAFFLDFAQYVGWAQGTYASLARNLLEVNALMFFGYSYYWLARVETKG